MGISDDRKIEQIENKLAWINDKKEEATDLTSQIKNKSTRYTNAVNTLEKIRDEATVLAREYKTKERSIQSKLNQAEKFYNQGYLPLKNQITNKQTGLKRLIQQGEAFFKELENKREKVLLANQLHLENVKELKSILTEGRKSGKSITILKTKSNTEVSNIEKKLADAQKVLTNIKNHSASTSRINNDLTKLLSNSKNEYDQIVKLKESISNSEVEINEIKENAIKTNDEILKLYGFANNTTMAGAFDDRKQKLEIVLSSWHTKIIATSIGLFLAIVSLLLFQVSLNEWSFKDLGYDFYLRFIFIGPIFYYVVFCNSQYNHTQKMLDKYTFKATVSLTIEAHTELLNRSYIENEYKQDILKFSLESLNKIYDRPYVDEILMAKIKESTKAKSEGLTIESLRKELSSKDSELYKLLSSISGPLTEKKQ